MNDIPTGIVTFLFTDIEGSTKLYQDFPESMPAAIEKHNSILNESVNSFNGFVFKTVGDAFCCAFSNPDEAVNAAFDAQTKLSSAEWNDAVINVRMGIHSGRSEWNGKDYMGYVTLARTQRIMSSAYGGQILISDDAFGSIGDVKPDNFSFRDLGERRLKDLIQPMKLYQIVSDKIQSDFPPLKTLDARPNNLSVQLTSFIGREKEISEIRKLLSGTRLLSILGPGGTGKTRMALQTGADVIDEFNDGVWITELAPLSDPELVLPTIARSAGISEQPGQKTETTLLNYLKEKELLIILDNCEHLIEEASKTAEKILQFCSKVKIIATSREALRSDGETVFRILSLSHPDPAKKITPLELSQYEAVRLFIERALTVNPNFRINNDNAPALAQICFQLDGIPLAIELAAARVNILNVQKISQKLNDRFRLLTGGKRTALPRQQTLKAMIDWSYDLLTEKEKKLFQRLSVFTGGWVIEAAEEICTNEEIDNFEMLDVHTNLLDKSLIYTSEKSGSVRFYLLETVKQYADEKLGEDTGLRRNHYNYFSSLADHESMKLKGIDQLHWVRLIDTELDNIRAAILWASENDTAEACRLIYTFSEFWKIKGYFLEGLQTCIKILNSGRITDEFSKAKVLFIAALMNQNIGNSAEAERFLEESHNIFRKVNSLSDIGNCLNISGLIYYSFKGDYEKAYELHNQAISIFRELDIKSGIAFSFYNISFTVHLRGDSDLAMEYKKESLRIYKELNDLNQVSLVQASIGVFEYKRDNLESAKSYSEESLAIANDLGNKYLICINLINLGCVYIEYRQYEKARQMLEEALTIIKEYGYTSSLLVALLYLGNVESGSGNYINAISYYKQSILTGSEAGVNFFLSTNIFLIAKSYFELKDYITSLKYLFFLKTIIEFKNDPLGNANLSEAENLRNTICGIIGKDRFDEIQIESLKLSKEEIVRFALSDVSGV